MTRIEAAYFSEQNTGTDGKNKIVTAMDIMSESCPYHYAETKMKMPEFGCGGWDEHKCSICWLEKVEGQKE